MKVDFFSKRRRLFQHRKPWQDAAVGDELAAQLRPLAGHVPGVAVGGGVVAGGRGIRGGPRRGPHRRHRHRNWRPSEGRRRGHSTAAPPPQGICSTLRVKKISSGIGKRQTSS